MIDLDAQYGGKYDGTLKTSTNKTGINIENLPAKSSIEVSIDAGEHYPLVYVLLCQKLP
jgi:hypothetical protein